MSITYKIIPIGFVRKTDDVTYLDMLPQFAKGLYRLDEVSHAFVIWWIDQNDVEELRKVKNNVIPRIKGNLHPPQEMGTFTTRSPRRPNPLGLTLVKITKIEGSKIYVDSLDAFDNTPVIDIKPYLPNGDRIDAVCLPPEFEHLTTSRANDLRLKK
jgi:tRNA-Thr(GGU) m(6)t(6)A37 methyltransferase TsaA